MIIHGKERGFKMTTGAAMKIADLCPDGDLSNLEQALESGSMSKNVAFLLKMLSILSEGYELEKAFIDPTYHADPITVEELSLLSLPELMSIKNYGVGAIEEGTRITVEVEPTKKEETTIA